jgi:hypothetical protein
MHELHHTAQEYQPGNYASFNPDVRQLFYSINLRLKAERMKGCLFNCFCFADSLEAAT